MSAPPAVRLVAAGKIYPGGVTALQPIDLEIAAGETVALVGPSGAGKTTLLHLIGGVIRPDSGRVELAGRSIAHLEPGRGLARLVGIIHQQFDLVPQLSVLHNVLAGRLGEWGLIRSLVSLIWPREAPLAEAALDRVGLAGYRGQRVARLSGGEQQRVAIARLLVQNPRILLADEPVASLDPALAEDLLELLTGIARAEGKTLVASLHSIGLARRFFDRIVGLRDGRIWFDRTAREVADLDLEHLYALADRAGR